MRLFTRLLMLFVSVCLLQI